MKYDALLLVSFGGPEGPADVMPFLENVVRGKQVPGKRLEEVAQHYHLMGGVSPINSQCRALIAALLAELDAHGPQLPVYWGNRHWHPMLADAIRQMAEDGIQRALAFVTSAFGSYPGCRAYLEDIERARREVGPAAPQIEKLRVFYNHPGFIAATTDRVRAALEAVPVADLPAARLLFTAHSIPLAMAGHCPYEDQLREACHLVVEELAKAEGGGVTAEAKERVAAGRAPPQAVPQSVGVLPWELVYQSRSGPPTQPWLEPQLGDRLRELAREDRVRDVVVVPIGFLCEHMEVAYDLDIEVRNLCEELGIRMVRAGTVGCHPRLVQMIRELILERIDREAPRLALGTHGPAADQCSPECCRG